MFKKKRYKLTFHKRWLEGKDAEHYKMISDSDICAQSIQLAQAYNLDIKQMHLSNLYACVIVLKGTKTDYLYFVRKFVEENKIYLEKIKF